MICLCCFFSNCSKYKVDGIGLIFLGMYILGRRVGTYAFHFMGHLRSKVMDESLNYTSIRMQRHFGGNLAMHLSIFEVRT